MAGKITNNGFRLYIHPSNAEFYNLDNDYPAFKIRPGDNWEISVSKINIQSISTPTNPCLLDEKSGDSCIMKKVL